MAVTPDGASTPQIGAQAGGTAQGQRADYSFFPTFQGTSDNGPRRAADIVGGFNGCAWGCEYLSFNVGSGGSPNDVGALTDERMRITAAGNVGIGTISPVAKVDVRGFTSQNSTGTVDSEGYDIQVLSSQNRPWDGAIIALGGAWGPTGYIKTAAISGTAGDIIIGNRRSSTDAGMTPGILLDMSGNVGIGTTDPQYPLSVNGTIQAKEVIVNTGWSDYVFAPGYKLLPLAEVAQYIKRNHHLPGIPSEAEVEKDGVSLGQMQAKLLAQIEELTLQVIQLQREVNKLKKTNATGSDK